MSAPEAGRKAVEEKSPADSGRSGSTTATEDSLAKFEDIERGRIESGATAASPDVPGSVQGPLHIINWEGPDDPGNPYNFSPARKWLITSTALLCTFLVPMNGTAITVAPQEINAEFGISDASFPNSYWPVFSWGMGCATFLIIGLPLMEDLGIRKGFLISYVCFFLFIIPQAVSQNFQTLVVTRFFSGGFGELPTSAVASIIPDLWEDGKGRSIPISLLNLCCMLGLTIGPTVFAPVIQFIGNWRWIFYIQLIVYGALFPAVFFCLEETRGGVILQKRAKKLRKANPSRPVYAEAELNAPTFQHILKISASRPFYLLGTEPVLVSISLWSAFSFGNVFLFTQSTEQVFPVLYGWKSYSCGYVLGAVAIGEVIGWMVNAYGIRLYTESAKRNTEDPGQPIPESRLYISILGSFFGITGGMFVYGWTSHPSIPWIGPAIGLAMVGFGIQTVVCAACDYLEDAYAASDYAATAVSALAFLENTFASFLPLATKKMYSNLGFHWASSLLGILALLISLGPVLFTWKGRWFRERSRFMGSGGESAPGLTISGQQAKHEALGAPAGV